MPPPVSRINTKPTTAGTGVGVNVSGGGLQVPALPTTSLNDSHLLSTTGGNTLASDSRSLALVTASGTISRIGQAPAYMGATPISVSVGTSVGGGAFVAALGSLPAAQGRLILQSTAPPQYLQVTAQLNVSGPSDAVQVYGRLYNLTQGPSGTVYASGMLVNASTPYMVAACGDTTSAKARSVLWDDFYDISATGATWASNDSLALQVFVKATGNSSVTLAGTMVWSYEPPQVAGLPSAPSSVAVSSAASTSLTLGWTAPAGATPDHYLIEFDPTVGSGPQTYAQSLTATGGATSSVVSGLAANTSYALRISAFTADLVQSAYATLGNSTTWTAPLAPTAVGLGAATATTQVVGFTPPSTATNLTYAIKYSTHSDMSSATTSVATISGNAATVGSGGDAALAWSAANTYYWTVTATNSVSGRAATSSTLTSYTPPTVVSLSTGTVTGSSVALSWPDPGSNYWSGFVVKYGTSSPPSSTWSGTSPTLVSGTWSVVVSGLGGSALYYFSVAAIGPGAAGTAAAASTTTASSGGYDVLVLGFPSGQSNEVGQDTSASTQYGGYSTTETSTGIVDANGNNVLMMFPDLGQATGTAAKTFSTYLQANGSTSGAISNQYAETFARGALWPPGVGTNVATNTNVNAWSTLGANDMHCTSGSGSSTVTYAVTAVASTGPTRTVTAPVFADIGDATGVSFVYEVVKWYAANVVTDTSRRLVIVPVAISGAQMHSDTAGAWKSTSGLFQRAINGVNAVLATTPTIGSNHKVVALLGQQGESDAINGNQASWGTDWLNNVHTLQSAWSTHGGSTMAVIVAPFVSGYTEYTGNNSAAGNYCTLTKTILGLPSNVSGYTGTDTANTRVVSTLGLNSSGGNSASYSYGLHWGARKQRQLGARFINALRDFLGGGYSDPSGLDQSTLQPPSGLSYVGGTGVLSFNTQATSWRTTANAWAYAVTATTGGTTVNILVTELNPTGSTALLPYSTTSYTSGSSTYAIGGTTYTIVAATPTFTPPSSGASASAQLTAILGTPDVVAASVGSLLATPGAQSSWSFSVKSVAFDPNATTYTLSSTAATYSYVPPYNTLSLAVKASTYACTFTRTAATANASLVVKTAGGTTVATFNGTVTWTSNGTYTVNVGSGNSSGWTAPVDGTAYNFVLTDATDSDTSTSANATYVAPYNTLSVGSNVIGATTYYVTFTRAASATAAAGLAIKDASNSNAVVATFTGSATWTAAGTTSNFALTSGNCSGFSNPTGGHSYFATLSDATDDSFTLSSANVTALAAYNTPSVSSVTANTYNVSITRNASATANATLVIKTAGGTTVATFSGTPTWTSAGTVSVAVTSSNSSGWTAPVGGTSYTATIADAADASFTATSSSTAYTAPYNTASVASFTSTSYVVTFTRAASATAAAGLVIKDASSGNAVVATFTGSATWTGTGTTTNFSLTSGNCSGFSNPTASHNYFVELTDATDDSFVLDSATTTYTAGYVPTNTSGCILWLKGDDASTVSGATWADQSGSGNNATAVTGGSYGTTNTPTYSSGVGWNFSAGLMTVGGVDVSMGSAFSIFWVGNQTSVTSGAAETFVGGGAAPPTISYYGGLQVKCTNQSTIVNDGGHTNKLTVNGSPAYTAGGDAMLGITWDGTTLTLVQNGPHVLSSSSTVGSWTSGNKLYLGARSGSGATIGEALTGQIKQVAAYSACLSGTDLANITTFMTGKYSLTYQT